MAVFDFDPPLMGDNPDATTRYLYRLVEQLRYTLDHIGDVQTQTSSGATGSINEEIASLRTSVRMLANALENSGFITLDDLPIWDGGHS